MRDIMRKSGRSSNSKSGQVDSLHVTFAEHTDHHVINSDSGIFLANDDVIMDIPSVDNRNKCDKDQPIKSVRPILKLKKCVSVESQDNPFLRDGELMKKADYIINNSTISRKRIRIADPDLVKSESSQQTAQQTVEILTKPEDDGGDIVKIDDTDLRVMTRMSKDDLVVLDICSSDSNRDQSSLEDVRSLSTSDRSPIQISSHTRHSNQQSLEIRNDANVLQSDAHDRLLVNLPEEDALIIDHMETSTPLLPPRQNMNHHPTTDRQSQMSAQKMNGENPQLRTSAHFQSKLSETPASDKTGSSTRAKKKKKCCLLQ